MTQAIERPARTNGDVNKLYPEDRAVHDWYRFVLSFPPHLVRDYLRRFEVGPGARVLDPFCGTGTTLVECKKLGIGSVGIEANPMAFLASSVKLRWNVDAKALLEHAERVAEAASDDLRAQGIDDVPVLYAHPSELPQLRRLPPEINQLLLTDSISPLPLHKTLVLIDHLERLRDERFADHERLALAKAVVCSISNLHFGPEVGVSPAKLDAPVVDPWLACVRAIALDISLLSKKCDIPSAVYRGDSRQMSMLDTDSIDAVITSPPYPNEKDYTRTTRLESVLLGFVGSRSDLRTLKQELIRSNTRSVYKADDDDEWVAEHPEIQRIAADIEARRIELGKTSGFERLYPRVTKLYFGGMARHLADLRRILRPGARLAYVVGDQASYLRIMIRTGKLLGDIARSLGYEVQGMDVFRTRLATATREQLEEHVVILRWPA